MDTISLLSDDEVEIISVIVKEEEKVELELPDQFAQIEVDPLPEVGQQLVNLEVPEDEVGDHSNPQHEIQAIDTNKNIQLKPVPSNEPITEINFNPKLFYCALCLHSFKRKVDTKRHLLKHHDKKNTFICTECGMRFRTMNGLRVHKWRHTAVKCNFCKNPFIYCSNNINLIRHIRIYHSHSRDASSLVVEPIHCSENSEVVNERESLNEELLEANEGIPQQVESDVSPRDEEQPLQFTCDICSEKFTDKNERRLHIKEVHFGIKREFSLTEGVICID